MPLRAMGQLQSLYAALKSITAPEFINWLVFGKGLAEQPLNQSRQEYLPKSTHPRFTLQTLPIELLLHVFSFLELKPYIISHAVCKEWLRLLPLSDLHPIRRRLFNLYHHMLDTPNFLMTRQWTLDNIRPFDRQGYIDALLSQYPVIPEEFRIRILEWPICMIIGCTWPGFPFSQCRTVSHTRRHGINWLGYRNHSPRLSALIYKNRTLDVKFVPGLLIWRDTSTTDWLIFDHDEPTLFGRVFALDFLEYPGRCAIIPHVHSDTEESQNIDSDATDDDTSFKTTFSDWISYQLDYWNESTSRNLPPEFLEENGLPTPDTAVRQPVQFQFEGGPCSYLPAPMWESRHTATEYLEYN